MAQSLDVYRVIGTAGKVGTPGASILSYDLLVHESTGKISGHASITQAIAPPGGQILINNVTGIAHKLIFGGTVSLAISLQGTYDQALPPTDLIIVEKFSASFQTDTQWNGRGAFTYGNKTVSDVPVKSIIIILPSLPPPPPPYSGPVPLYMATLHQAVASGELVQLKAVLAEAQSQIASIAEVQAALPELQAAIKKAGG